MKKTHCGSVYSGLDYGVNAGSVFPIYKQRLEKG
jgi:hypothetical protein